jgi:hypothetical protein
MSMFVGQCTTVLRFLAALMAAVPPLQTLTIGWSPGRAAFFANDREASDLEPAHLYDPKTLTRLDLSGSILAADSGAARFFQRSGLAPHSYLRSPRWVDDLHVEV